MDRSRQGATVRLSPSGKRAMVLSDDGQLLLVDVEGRAKWIKARDARVASGPRNVTFLTDTLRAEHGQQTIGDFKRLPGRDGAMIRVGDWVTGEVMLPELRPTGVGAVAGFTSVDGSIRVEVDGPGMPVDTVALVDLTRVLRGDVLAGGPSALESLEPRDFLPYRCHVCGCLSAKVNPRTGVAARHVGSTGAPCRMEGRRLIDEAEVAVQSAVNPPQR